MRYSVTRYAVALRAVVSDLAEFRDAIAVLTRFADATDGDAFIRTFFNNRSFPEAKRMEVVQRAIGADASKAVLPFLRMLITHGRIGDCSAVVRAAQAIADAEARIARVQVTTAVPLSDRARDGIERALTDVTGRHVDAAYAVDPQRIGGVHVIVDGTIAWDGTVAGRIARLRAHLANV